MRQTAQPNDGPAVARRPRLLIFFPFQQTARLDHTVKLLGQARATVVVPPGTLPNLGSTPGTGHHVRPAP